VCIQVIGAGALNQAVKAVAIAVSFVEEDGIDLVCVPSFHDVDIGGENRTALRLQVESRTGVRPVRAESSASVED
jgi:stage V sporulation protein S